ncbi:MAG: tRNA pseudouridine(38-40) synthase TruA [Flavobacteriaceae bacterium]|nr:tRNA pseudouridine(38-40) synthase TruA [Flavobacteriaceae bacterium]
MRYFLKLAYNGTAYHGWQVQPGDVTVQDVLQKSMGLLLRKKTVVVGAGRTDTGVHASEYFAHFDSEEALNHDFALRLNSLLPKDIAVYLIYQMTDEAHARFDALSRTYEYTITSRKDPFLLDKAYYSWGKIDLAQMNQAAEILKTYCDFEAFSKTKTTVNNYLCRIDEANWRQEGDLFIFKITANRFLRNMVRAIVGTMLDIGRGKRTPESLHEIITSKNRLNAGASAPAQGLSLIKISYPESIFRSQII